MKKISKLLAAGLAAASILSTSIPALADDQTAPAPVSTSAPTTGQTPTTPAPANAQDRIAKAKERIQNEIVHLQQAKELQPYMQQIKSLQAQEKDLKTQIQTQRQTLRDKIKADRQAKNYDALLTALNDMVPMMDDLSDANQAAQASKSDWQQLKTDRTANNQAALTTDLQKIQSDIQDRITIYQKILTDLQKVNQDLGTPSTSTPNTSSSTSSNNSNNTSTTNS